jgi:predicted kinase
MQGDLNALSYEVMWRYAEKQLLCGLSVIVDSPLARRELFVKGKRLAHKASAFRLSAQFAMSTTIHLDSSQKRTLWSAQFGGEVVIVECAAMDSVAWRSRLEARSSQQPEGCDGHKPQTWADLEVLLAG